MDPVKSGLMYAVLAVILLLVVSVALGAGLGLRDSAGEMFGPRSSTTAP